MSHLGRTLFACAFAALGLGALTTASIIAWRVIAERWYIAQLESPSLGERRSAVEKLAAMRSERAMPAIARVVAKSEDAGLRIIGLRALAALGRKAEGALPVLVEFLLKYKPEKGQLRGPYRIAFKIHFGTLRCPEEMDWVYPRLMDPVQTELAATFAALGPASVSWLLEALKQASHDARRDGGESFGFTAISALIQLGEASVSVLVDALDDNRNGDLQCAAVYALCEIGAPAIPALLERLEKGSSSRRHEAARLLGEIGIGTRPVLESLERMLDDSAPDVRTDALDVIASIQPEATVQPERLAKKLLELSDGDDPFHRCAAVRALGRLDLVARDQVRAVYDRYRFAPRDERERLADTVELLGPGAVPFLIEDLDSKDGELASSSQSLLWQIGASDARAYEKLVRTLGSLDPPIRARVQTILDRIDPALVQRPPIGGR